jgi:hypothetical protein
MIDYKEKKYARVSEVLQPYTNFSHIDPVVLQNKCDIGTEVHQAIASDIDDDLPVFSKKGEGYYKSYLKWRDCLNVEFAQSEQRYYDDEWMITGQIDAIITIPDQIGLFLVDFKTSATESAITWPMQAHLYHRILKKNNVHVRLSFNFIKLDKRGNLPQVFTYQWNENVFARCEEAVKKFWKQNGST